MNISVKKTVAILLVLAMCTLYFAACGVKDADNGSEDSGASVDQSGVFQSSEEDASSQSIITGDESDMEESTNIESTEGVYNSSETKDDVSSAEDNDTGSEESKNDGSEVNKEDNASSDDDSTAAPPKDDSSVAPPAHEPSEDDSTAAPPIDDSSVIPPDDSSVAPPAHEPPEDDSTVAPPPVDDSSVTPPVDDSSVTPPVDDSSVAPPVDDSSVTPPVDDSSIATPPVDDSTVAPPPVEDSSEESSYVPSSPSDPLTLVPESLYADHIDSFFIGSVFVGYSIMMHFGRYVNQWRTEIDSTIMGNSINVGAVGISFYKNSTQTPSTPDNSLPYFRGKTYNFEDLPAATGSKTMYIGLTCYSDMKYYGSAQTCPQEAAAAVIEGVKKIVAKNPGVNIVLISGTYNTGTFESLGYKYATRLSNSNIRKFNNYVLDYCNQYGVDFIDVATPLTNGYGNFVIEYSSDNDYHIAREPFKIWIEILRDYARKKQAGNWRNIAVMPVLGA